MKKLLMVLGFLAITGAASAQVANHFKANNCEFYVNSIGRAYAHNMAFSQRSIEVYLSVDEASLVKAQRGKILEVGAFVNGPAGERFLKALAFEPAYYQLNIPVETFYPDGRQDITPAQELAFYVDVLRSTGVAERLWLTDGQRNFNVAEIFGHYPTVSANFGARSVDYVSDFTDSAIYHQKKACAR